jgi:class 3 adenylate cyclase
MKAMPSLTARALAMHNAVMRKAVRDHAGHVLRQEGDSWALAFHEATDAVGFCMQAQQALQRVRAARRGNAMWARRAARSVGGRCAPRRHDTRPPNMWRHRWTGRLG